MSKKTVLITGGLGYIGSSLIRHLKNKYHLIVVDNLTYDQMPLVYPILDGVEFHFLDVREEFAMAELASRADIVIPLAALVGAPLCERQKDNAKSINLDAVKFLVESLREDQLVIFPNTNSGYGDTGGAICTEETPLKAISWYGETKDKAEQEVLKHKNSVVFRLATVFGYSPRPRLDLLVNTLTFDAYHDKEVKLFDDSFMRNYIHVKDICRAFEFAIDNADKMRGQVYNLGNDDVNMTKGDLVRTIAKHIDFTTTIIGDRTDPDKRNYIISSAKLYGLGWSPAYSLDYGIKELIEYFDWGPFDWTNDETESSIMDLMRNA